MDGSDSSLKLREDDIFVTLLKYNYQTFVSRQIRKAVLQGVLGNMTSEILNKILENLMWKTSFKNWIVTHIIIFYCFYCSKQPLNWHLKNNNYIRI